MRMHRVCKILFIVIGLCLGAAPVLAEQIQIHITGLNFTYDGSDIYDSTAKAGGTYNTAQADPLATIDFFKDGVQVGSLTANDGIFADLLIDSVHNVPVNGGMVTTGDGIAGFGLDLLQSVGQQTTPLLSLNTKQLTLSYSGAGIYIAVGGLADSLVAQNLPFGLTLTPQAPISLVISSSNISNLTTSGNYVSGFDAFGTGDINGTHAVPEPASLTAAFGIAAIGLTGLFLRRRKMTA
jgi:hypothetical protein